jgi:hypothetical protein
MAGPKYFGILSRLIILSPIQTNITYAFSTLDRAGENVQKREEILLRLVT